MRDTIEEDESVITDRVDEQVREQRWAAFQATAQEFAVHDWFYPLEDMARAYLDRDRADAYGPGRFAWHVQQFAESEGWPAALSAIARAMKEHETRERQQQESSL